MKKIALMQPYLFPYIGYFQLIKAVDVFIVYDDVQWMKGGWINRNRVLIDGQPEYIILPIKKDSHTKNINEREFPVSFQADKQAMLEKIREAYSYAPYFNPTLQVIERCFEDNNLNAAEFITHALQICCEYLDITTKIIMSSEMTDKTEGLRAQDRVIDIVSRLGATNYINAIGGQELYSRQAFAEHNIKLSFIKPHLTEYKQYDNDFVPGLSIIDVMMFNSKEEVLQLLNNYELLS